MFQNTIKKKKKQKNLYKHYNCLLKFPSKHFNQIYEQKEKEKDIKKIEKYIKKNEKLFNFTKDLFCFLAFHEK